MSEHPYLISVAIFCEKKNATKLFISLEIGYYLVCNL